MEMKIPAIAITAVVVIVVLAGVLMPVLDDATTTEEKFTNTNYLWRMSEIEEGDTYVFDGTSWTFNDESLSLTNTTSNALVGGNWAVRSNGNLRGATITGNATALTATANAATVSLSGSSISSYTVDLPGYGANDEGDFIMTSGEGVNYVLGDSVIFGTGQSTIDTVNVTIHVEGTVKDGVTFTGYSLYGGTEISDVEFSNVSIVSTPVEGFKDLYTFDKCTATITFKTTSDSVTHTGDVTYNRVVTPYQVTAEKSVHFTDNQNAIFAAIPIMVIVALLIAVVALVFRGRDF